MRNRLQLKMAQANRIAWKNLWVLASAKPPSLESSVASTALCGFPVSSSAFPALPCTREIHDSPSWPGILP